MTAIALPTRHMVSPVRARTVAPLRVPLLYKLAVADLVALMLAATLASRVEGSLLKVALLVSSLAAAQLVLLVLALRPVRTLELTAGRILAGDTAARVAPSLLADFSAQRVGDTLNGLLDTLAADRRRFRRLAVVAIESGDCERALIGRELHDSIAQQVAALAFQLTALSSTATDDELRSRLELLRRDSHAILEDLRRIADGTRSTVLETLGLVPALHQLVRESNTSLGPTVTFRAGPLLATLQPAVQAVIYRVAQEAVRNAIRHGAASHVEIALSVDDSEAVLSVNDDGVGFDIVAAQRDYPALGLFMMQERMALLEGRIEIDSPSGIGTRIRARAPLGTPVLPSVSERLRA